MFHVEHLHIQFHFALTNVPRGTLYIELNLCLKNTM